MTEVTVINEFGNMPGASTILSDLTGVIEKSMKEICDRYSLADARLLWFALGDEVDYMESLYMLTKQHKLLKDEKKAREVRNDGQEF